MKKLAHKIIYYVGVIAIFLSILAIFLSVIGIFSKHIGIESFSSDILRISVIVFSIAMGLSTYLNIYFLHNEIAEMKNKPVE